MIEQIEWGSKILLLLSTGEIKMLDLETKEIVKIEALEGQRPTCIKWHPRIESVAAIGYQSGHVSFFDV